MKDRRTEGRNEGSEVKEGRIGRKEGRTCRKKVKEGSKGWTEGKKDGR